MYAASFYMFKPFTKFTAKIPFEYWSHTVLVPQSIQSPTLFFSLSHSNHCRENTRVSNWIRLKHFSFNGTIIKYSFFIRLLHENEAWIHNQAKLIKRTVVLWKIIKGVQAHFSIHQTISFSHFFVLWERKWIPIESIISFHCTILMIIKFYACVCLFAFVLIYNKICHWFIILILTQYDIIG